MRHPGRSSGRKQSITRSPSVAEQELRDLRDELTRRSEEQAELVAHWQGWAHTYYHQARSLHEQCTTTARELQSFRLQHEARNGVLR